MGMATTNLGYNYNILLYVLSNRRLNEETNKVDFYWDFAETDYVKWIVDHCKGKWEWQWNTQQEDFHERLFVDLYFEEEKDYINFCEAFPDRDYFDNNYEMIPIKDTGNDKLREVEIWLMSNAKKHWVFDVTEFGKLNFWFANKQDAASFKMVWYIND